MSFDINIYGDEALNDPLETLKLGSTLLDEGVEGLGEPKKLFVRNEGDGFLLTANINLEGPGAESIQLARDENGVHGIWAQPGQGIIALANEVGPGETFAFWARGVFDEDDAGERKNFTFELELVGRR